MKVLLVVIVFLLIDTSATYNISATIHRHSLEYDDPRDLEYNIPYTDVEFDISDTYNIPETEAADSQANIEVDMLQCPQSCVCQYASLKDLPISRWIYYMQRKYTATSEETLSQASQQSQDEFLTNNESTYTNDMSYAANTLIKQATCIIQEDSVTNAIVSALPTDLQALSLLYTGVGKNKTVNTSEIKDLKQLNTLEVRGPQDRSLSVVMDAPLINLKHANFEFTNLIGSEIIKRPKNFKHPKEAFNYKPNIELLNSIDFNKEVVSSKQYDHKLLTELQQQEQEELEIVPYEVYMEEVKKSKMPSFYGWHSLEVLRIQACGLSELSWEMFVGLDELQHLSLERNNIQVVPPFALSGATQLRTLSLAHNNIHDLHYRHLAGLFELEVLDISDNNLNKLTELSFPPLPKVKLVDFRDNPIRYIFPATFWVMNNTRRMFFGSDVAFLELWGNQPFKKLTKLSVLEINNVSIQNLEQNIFKDLISLQKLKLRGEVKSIEFDAFSGFQHLEELDLENCRINYISMDAFFGCNQLRIINLSSNNLSYIPPGLFDDQPQLEEIYLNNNALRSLPSSFFQKRKLKIARLSDNPWKCSCDMLTWKAKITNQETAPITERCLKDYLTGTTLSCKRYKSYKFNKLLAPRCENFKGRSVYYVLRKQLLCGKKYIEPKPNQVPLNRGMPYWRKLQKSQLVNKQRNRHRNEEERKQMQQGELPLRFDKSRNLFKTSEENVLSYKISNTIQMHERLFPVPMEHNNYMTNEI